MLASQKKILKRNDGFKELVLTCFGDLVTEEHARLYQLYTMQLEAEAQKKKDESNSTEPPEEGYYSMPDHEKRLFDWLLTQLKSNIFINPSKPLEAKAHHVEAVLSMFLSGDADGEDIEYMEVKEGENVNLNDYVNWDKSLPIIKAKILASEYLYGQSL